MEAARLGRTYVQQGGQIAFSKYKTHSSQLGFRYYSGCLSGIYKNITYIELFKFLNYLTLKP